MVLGEEAEPTRQAQVTADSRNSFVGAPTARVAYAVCGVRRRSLDFQPGRLGAWMVFAPAAGMLGKLPSADSLGGDLAAAAANETPEEYLIKAAAASTGAMVAVAACVLFLAPQVDAIAIVAAVASGILAFFTAGVALTTRPAAKAAGRAAEINRELPFALRHLATQVKAGVDLTRALSSVANADYGKLGHELRRTVSEMNNGTPADAALANLSDRTASKGLKQAAAQLARALRTGGKLSDILAQTAAEAAFEQRMRMRDYTEQLNLVGVAFMMTGVVAPVVITIIAAVMQLPLLGGGANNALVALAFIAAAAASAGVLVLAKNLEP